jgi:nucleoside 2-deoxyribosyltransferase
MKPKLYLASPLFNTNELSYNERLCESLKPFFSIYLPQRDGDLLDSLIKNHVKLSEAKQRIFQSDILALLNSDYLLINLNGRTVDEGAVFELGFAYAKKIKCYGIQTDIRRLSPYGNNLMIDESIEEMFYSENELINWAVNETNGLNKAYIQKFLV